MLTYDTMMKEEDTELVGAVPLDEEAPKKEEKEVAGLSNEPMMKEEETEQGAVSLDEQSPTKVDSGSSKRTNSEPTNRWLWVGVALAVLVIAVIVVVLAVTLTRDDDEEEIQRPEMPPVKLDFRTGVSLITAYSVDATISRRLARTVIAMTIKNALDCVSIHGVTIQLPLSARVAKLSTIANNGCTTHGEVKALEEARDDFAETATHGIPGAYVEARSSEAYSIQVSLPALGSTEVELVIEEVLQQEVGKVEFNIPFIPNEEVDSVSLDVKVLDTVNVTSALTQTGLSKAGLLKAYGLPFQLNVYSGTNEYNSPFTLHIPNARNGLPPILHGSFTPAVIPDQGVLYKDSSGKCFEHIFLPSSLESIPKNMLFLWDTSTYGSRKKAFFNETRYAMKDSIDLLTSADSVTIQTYSSRGTMDHWTTSSVTDIAKVEAKAFIDRIEPERTTRINFHEAILESLLRVKKSGDDDSVTLLILISNSEPSKGNTNHTLIASDVWKQNRDGKVKIFPLGSPHSDMKLLNAIAIMNGGEATSIPGAKAPQIVQHFKKQFGEILLSDVNVNFFGNKVGGMTQHSFSVLTHGTEVVVRGLVYPDNTPTQESLLGATTSALTGKGRQSWNTTALFDPLRTPYEGNETSHCFQSYAHARVTQLMHWRDIADMLGDDVVEPVVTLAKECDRETSTLAYCIEQEALSLAIQAELVTSGLTGMVTIDDQGCFIIQEGAEICLDGTSKGEFWEGATTGGGNGGDMEDGASWDHGDTFAPGAASPAAEAPVGYDSGYQDESNWKLFLPLFVTAITFLVSLMGAL